MKRTIFVVALVLTFRPIAAQDISPENSIVENHNNFAFKVYEHLGSDADNLIFSPISLYAVLAQAYGGAVSTTADQLADLLQISIPDEEFHRTLAALISDIGNLGIDEVLELSIAGALWPQDGYPIVPEFLELMAMYGATLRPVDYIRRPEQARRIINTWAEENTNGLIDNFLEPGIFTPKTRFNITNAVYFKGLWTSRFDRKDTESIPFYTTPEVSHKVEMMNQMNRFKFLGESDFHATSLPYMGDSVTMVIFLPYEIDGLPKTESFLAETGISSVLDELIDQSYSAAVDVLLPRFSFRYKLDTESLLIDLGVTDAFTPGIADFSGIDGTSNWLFVESLLHDAFIEVNEDGTKAAAVTMGGGCFPAGTPIMTTAGPVPIEDIQEGTGIPSYDMDKQRWVDTVVSGVRKRAYERDIITIRVGDEIVEATGNHPFFVLEGDSLSSRPRPMDLPAGEPLSMDFGRWVEARDMEVGDILLGKNGRSIRVSQKKAREESIDVYNLQVDDYHNYCVGSFGILVHNKGGAEEKVMDFHADHPFLYIIVEQNTRCILFMGRVTAP